jgi:hypothetical protein
MAVGWTVAATAGANRPTQCIPIPSNQLSGPALLFNLLLTNHLGCSLPPCVLLCLRPYRSVPFTNSTNLLVRDFQLTSRARTSDAKVAIR